MSARIVAGSLAALVAVCASTAQTPLGSAFTYQGRLTQDGQPVEGNAHLVFRIFDADGTLLGAQTLNAIPVVNGLFTVQLNGSAEFGPNAFNGDARWLEVEANGQTLAPRQGFTATPYAWFSARPWVTGAGNISYTSGNVGIGTGSPTGKLALVNDSAAATSVDLAAPAKGAAWSHIHYGTSGDWYIRSASASGNVILQDSGGNVGIGTTAPYAKLEILGNVPGDLVSATTLNAGTSAAAVAGEHRLTFNAGYLGRGNAGVSGVALAPDSAGVWGRNDDVGSNGYGVRGDATGPSAIGVYGSATGAFGVGVFGYGWKGIDGYSDQSGGYGVRGNCTTSDGVGVYGGGAIGVKGESFNGSGVYGEHIGMSGISPGVYGKTDSPTFQASGVKGEASTGQTIGVWGVARGEFGAGVAGVGQTGGYFEAAYGGTNAAWFQGNVIVTGNVFKGGGGFWIDHPLAPGDKYLYHSFVESPEMKNLYDGIVVTDARGYATVALPAWFEALNRDLRYQLTVIDDGDQGDFVQAMVTQKVRDGRFVVRTSRPRTEVSWQVTGIRKDPFAEANRIPVEREKEAWNRGYYVHPEAYGMPHDRQLGTCGRDLSAYAQTP
jgi:hypothetical protein